MTRMPPSGTMTLPATSNQRSVATSLVRRRRRARPSARRARWPAAPAGPAPPGGRRAAEGGGARAAAAVGAPAVPVSVVAPLSKLGVVLTATRAPPRLTVKTFWLGLLGGIQVNTSDPAV